MNDDTGVPAAVFALRSKWADLILSGTKTVEIRRGRMKRMIDRMLIYRTGTGLIVGEARVKGMHAAPPETIWREYGAAACLTEKEFDEYAKGADRLYAYRLENPIRYGKPKTLSDIGLKTGAPIMVLPARNGAGRAGTRIRPSGRGATTIDCRGRPVGAAPVHDPGQRYGGARHITHVRRTAGPHRRIRERKHPWQGMTATSASSTGARSRTR